MSISLLPAKAVKMLSPSRYNRKARQAITAYVFLAPALIFFSIFFFYPIGLEFWASLQGGQPLIGESSYVGLDNYIRGLQDPRVLNSLYVTAYFALCSTLFTIIMGLGLALLLNQKLPGRIVIRAIIFFPYMISVVIIALIWRSILDPYLGILNSGLNAIGLPGQNWLTNIHAALPAIILLTVWQNMGYAMIIYLAGLQNIPHEYYEAAKIDGASSVAQFRFITLPLLQPTTLFLAVVTLIGNIQAVAPAYLITRGGPAEATRLYAYHVFNVAFTDLNIGYASALAFMMFGFILVLTLIQLWLGRNQIEY